jgi:hypothetical protein
MSASISRPVQRPQRLDRLWWLPPGGQGNGIDDRAWAPVLEVDADLVPPLLEAFRAAGVPAYAARAQAALSRRATRTAAARCYRIWVGTSAYGRAEETLIVVMRSLTELRSRSDRDSRP